MAVVVVLVFLLAAVSAQSPEPQPTAPPAITRQMDHKDLRRHIYTMEGALARAVQLGAQQVSREIRSVMPEVMALSGEPQARGVYLDGYGVYFDVSVPVLNQVMMWSLRTMMGPDESIVAALDTLKAYVEREKNPATRASLENMLQRLELQFGPLAGAAADQIRPLGRPAPGGVGAAMVVPEPAKPAAENAGVSATAPTPPPARLDKKYFSDPNAINRAYTEAVQSALIDTIVDYAMPTAIKPNEVLTIAARDNMQRDSLAPMDPYEEVVTLLLTVKGSDLAAYRTGQIDAAEVRRRVQIREF